MRLSITIFVNRKTLDIMATTTPTFDDYLARFRDWMTLKNYSPKTITCYLNSMKHFVRYCERRRTDWQTINGDYSGIRLFYIRILGRVWDMKKLSHSKKEKYLPVASTVI